MSEKLSLLEFIRELLFNDRARAEFAANPEKELAEHGLGRLAPEDVRDALLLIGDETNESNQNADFSRDYNTGFGGGHNGGGHHGGEHHHAPAPHHNESAAEYINRYITNINVDDRDEIIDASFNQQVHTGGGDFQQDLDIDSVIASGEGAVAAGNDIAGSTITTGDGNQVGDGNVKGDGNVLGDNNQAVTGDGNTSSFGAGDATSTKVGGDLNVGDGSAFATGGAATSNNTDSSTHGSFNTETSTSIADSFKDSRDQSIHDTTNTKTEIDFEESFNSDESTTLANSHNDNHQANQDNVDNFHA